MKRAPQDWVDVFMTLDNYLSAAIDIFELVMLSIYVWSLYTWHMFIMSISLVIFFFTLVIFVEVL